MKYFALLSFLIISSCIELNNDRYYNLACEAEEKKEYKKAIEYLDKVLEINPKDLFVLNNRGWDKFDLGDTLGALYDFNEMIKLDSTCDKGFYNRGQIFVYKQKYQEALEDFNKVISLKGGGPIFLERVENSFIEPPQKPETSIKDLYYFKGIADYYTKNLRAAFNDFTYCIKSGSFVADSYYRRAFVYYSLGNKEKACEDFQKATLYGYKISDKEYVRFCR